MSSKPTSKTYSDMIYTRTYLVALIFLLFSYGTCAQSKKSAQRYRLSETAIVETKDDKTKKSVESFDKRGNTIETINYDDEGKINNRETFVYKRGRLMEHAIYGKNNKLKERHTYSYNRWGDETEQLLFDEDNKLAEKSVSVYNAQKQRTQMLVYDESNRLNKKYIYIYNNKGLVAKRQTYNGSEQLISEKTYTYTYRKWKK